MSQPSSPAVSQVKQVDDVHDVDDVDAVEARGPVLVAGGTGFIGDALVAHLRSHGRAVVRGGRSARDDVVRCDVDDPASLRAALAGCTAAYYLVHGLKRGAGYAAWEERAAASFVEACAAASVGRVVYLGGPDPGPDGSVHLRARVSSGAVLRTRGAALGVDVVELRAAMILGARSDSFRLARDLALRLPLLAAPRWLDAEQAPVAVQDVVFALRGALTVAPGVYALPGPEVQSGRVTLSRMRRIAGLPDAWLPAARPSRRTAGVVAGALTRVQAHLARELVDGMGRGDLVARDPSIWSVLPPHTLMPVDEAITRALAEDDPGFGAHVAEGVVAAFARRAWGPR